MTSAGAAGTYNFTVHANNSQFLRSLNSYISEGRLENEKEKKVGKF